jgi:hypothetical protein
MSDRRRVILKHWHRSLAVCLPIALLALSIWSLNRQLHHYRLEEILASLATTANRYLALAGGLTILNYAILTGYDTLAVRYLRHLLPYRAAALVSFVSYAIGNSVGFALLSGSAIRYRFYSRWGFSKTEIAKIIVFCNLSFWVGLLSVGGVMFVKEPIAVPKILHLPFQSVYPLGLIFLTVVTLYLLGGTFGHQFIQVGRWTLPVLPLRLSLAQIAVTSLDWMLVAGVLYALLPAPVPLSYPGFFGIYLLALIAGLVSNVPGGLGVFESVMLLLLSPTVSAADLFGALLAYRGIYYLVPLILAVLLLGIAELRYHLAHRSPSQS